MRRIAIALVLVLVGACAEEATSDASATSTSTAVTATSTTVVTGTTVATTTTSAPRLTTTTSAAPDVVVSGGAVTGPERFSLSLGETVEILVLADVDDEVHVHGYDLHFDVVAGVPTLVSFIADVPGVFEAELEGSGLGLFDIEVAG